METPFQEYQRCELCPRRCGVDRLAGQRGRCGETAALRSFAEQEIRSVELLGCGPVPFKKELGVLLVSLPEKLPVFCTNALKIR